MYNKRLNFNSYQLNSNLQLMSIHTREKLFCLGKPRSLDVDSKKGVQIMHFSFSESKYLLNVIAIIIASLSKCSGFSCRSTCHKGMKYCSYVFFKKGHKLKTPKLCVTKTIINSRMDNYPA